MCRVLPKHRQRHDVVDEMETGLEHPAQRELAQGVDETGQVVGPRKIEGERAERLRLRDQPDDCFDDKAEARMAKDALATAANSPLVGVPGLAVAWPAAGADDFSIRQHDLQAA